MSAIWNFLHEQRVKVFIAGVLGAISAALSGATNWTGAIMTIAGLILPTFGPARKQP